jgi:hypothetical protein
MFPHNMAEFTRPARRLALKPLGKLILRRTSKVKPPPAPPREIVHIRPTDDN